MNIFRKLRKQHKLTQEKLAELVNVHQTAVSQWELGKTSPDKDVLVRLAKLYGVSGEMLLEQSIKHIFVAHGTSLRGATGGQT